MANLNPKDYPDGTRMLGYLRQYVYDATELSFYKEVEPGWAEIYILNGRWQHWTGRYGGITTAPLHLIDLQASPTPSSWALEKAGMR